MFLLFSNLLALDFKYFEFILCINYNMALSKYSETQSSVDSHHSSFIY